MSNPPPFVSIIIPVYNDSQRLKECLSLLENQTYPRNAYEVIVVDNNSTEDLKPIVSQFSQVQYVFESTPGSYSARNKGLDIAEGEILGFTDSDCSPAINWIEKGVAQILSHPNCGFIAGAVNFSFQNPQKPNPAEIFDSLHFLQQQKYVRENHYGATANLFTTSQIFDAVGRFNSDLKSGGDREWGERVYKAAYEQIYAADVAITHPARANFNELLHKLRRVYEGAFQKDNRAQTPLPRFMKEVLLEAKPPIRYLLEILRNHNIAELQDRIAVVYIYIRLRFARASVNLKLYLQEYAKSKSIC